MKSYSIEELFDHLRCPLFHHMKYEVKLEEIGKNEDKAGTAYREAMHETLYFYYSSLQNGRMPTLRQLYNKLTTLWNEKMGMGEEEALMDGFQESTRKTRSTREKHVLAGYEVLALFYKKEKEKDQVVIAVNHPYRVVLGDAVIEGNFELIREVLDKKTKTRFIEVVDFRTTKRKPEGFFLRHDLFATFMHYAFEQTFGKRPDRFVLDFIGQDTEVPLFRDENDYRRIRHVLAGIEATIEHTRPFPRQGFHCRQCPYQSYCDRWEFEN